MARQQAETDKAWRAASDGRMRLEKITYRSRAGNMEIPAFVFQPLKSRGPRSHPALVWVHEDIRGHLYEHYIPYIREATAKGYIVIAPEYRGGIGYGPALYNAIDYGGAEVDDVVTAVDVLRTRYPDVDPSRIGIIGWSHGGLIALLSVFRNPTTFKAAVAMVPVTNLFQRLAWKGIDQQRQMIDPQNRFGGSPSEKRGGVQGAIAAVRRRSAADPAVRRGGDQRSGREHRGEHAAHRRVAGTQAAAGRDEGVRESARRPPVRSPRRLAVAAREHARAARLVAARLGVSGPPSRRTVPVRHGGGGQPALIAAVTTDLSGLESRSP